MPKPVSKLLDRAMPGVPRTVSEVADEIRRYLAANANASDTVEGVQTWWLAPGVPGSTVQRALDALVAAGVVHKRQLPDGNRIYGARPPWPGKAANS
ncbi:MAG: hypothetical protein WCA12_08375 [Burkholderiales bacterium]